MSSTLKWSKHNYSYKSLKHNCWVLFNSVTGALITLDDENFTELSKLKADSSSAFKYANLEDFVEAKILVHDSDVDVNKKKLKVMQHRLSEDFLDLTIAPTLGCNFKCQYCFQDKLQKYSMSNETENNLLKFVKNQSRNAQLLRVTWFGGEPLLALNRIISFTKKVRDELDILIDSHLITNGYLLDENAIRNLSEFNLTFVQVTIDGSESVHNRRRPLHGNGGTFQTIVSNLESLLRINNGVKVAVRTNIDPDNMDDYHVVCEYIDNKFRGENIAVYPGFTDEYEYNTNSEKNCGSIECGTLQRNQRAKFLVEQYREHSVVSGAFHPIMNHNSCMARYTNSYVVGPRGDLYKCLALVGVKEMSVGNINDDAIIDNEELLLEFLKGNDYLESSECNNCLLFPVCDGGCPYLKIKEKRLGGNYDVCNLAKGNLEEFLDMHIDSRRVTSTYC